MTEILNVFGQYDYLVRESLLLVLVALGIYVLLNAGIFAVPQIGLMAIGGYTAAILSADGGLHWAVAVVVGAAVAGAAGFVLGIVLFRLDGIYLALASIGFNEIVRVTARNLDITGGAVGIVGVERAVNDLHILGALAIALLFLYRISRSHFGYAIEGLREDTLMASHQGVNLTRYRLCLFTLSGVLAGSGGALLVHRTGFIEPEHFAFSTLIEVLAAAVLGGMTAVLGPLVGGAVIFGLPAVLTDLAEYRDVVNGAIVVAVIAVVPQGLAVAIGAVTRRAYSVAARSRSRPTEPPAAVSAPEPARSAAVVDEDSGHAAEGGDPALEIEEISRSFGGVRALVSVSIDVERSEILGVIGPNGSGKTTLLNVISGVYKPDAGDMRFDGRSLRASFGQPAALRGLGIARTFQGIRLVPGRTVRDNVMLGAHLGWGTGFAQSLLPLPSTRRSRAGVRAEVDALLDELGLAQLADSNVASLPYGPQRKVEIARAMIATPRIVLLDEPTAGMSPGERADIFQLIERLRCSGVSVVIVEHEVGAISRLCDRIAVLNFGELIALGAPADVLAREVVVDAYIGRGSHD